MKLSLWNKIFRPKAYKAEKARRAVEAQRNSEVANTNPPEVPNAKPLPLVSQELVNSLDEVVVINKKESVHNIKTSTEISSEGETVEKEGNKTVYYDSQHRRVRTKTDDGTTIEYTYQGNGKNPTEAVSRDADGNQIVRYTWLYDNQGNVLQKKTFDGNNQLYIPADNTEAKPADHDLAEVTVSAKDDSDNIEGDQSTLARSEFTDLKDGEVVSHDYTRADAGDINGADIRGGREDGEHLKIDENGYASKDESV